MDHYAALGLRSDASVDQIRKAFRAMAARYHPDRNPDPAAVTLFRAAQIAWEVLGDADRRQAYDENRRRNLLDNPLDTATEIWQTWIAGVR